MNKRIVIKIGSNVLTRDDGTLDVTRMSALSDQIAVLYKEGYRLVIVSSGAVASGRSELKIDHKLDSVSSRQLFSAVGQVKLINRYWELFREHGIACGQVLTTKESFGSRAHYLNQQHCMEIMLENGVIPIVNENDTISVTELMFTDNDELSGLIAAMMNADKLIILSNINGIYDGDPSDPDSRVIERIDGKEVDVTRYVSAKRSSFGRGGMHTKCRIARKVADEGIEVITANGKRDDILLRICHSEESALCTRFIPSTKPVSSIKKWIANSDGFAKGIVRINRGAAEALTGTHAASILPVGVTSVEGEFEKDDIVRIVDHEGRQIGVGCISCGSTRARSLIGARNEKPLIHYDYLYLE